MSQYSRRFWESMYAVGEVRIMENGAFAILLAGCNPDDSVGDKDNCYKKMDRGWGDDAVPTMYRDGINNANTTVLDMIGMKSDVRKHFHWIPKRVMNAYPDGHFWGKFKPNSPYFLVHLVANGKHWMEKYLKMTFDKHNFGWNDFELKPLGSEQPTTTTTTLAALSTTTLAAQQAVQPLSALGDADLTSAPYIVNRFAPPGASPRICLHCVMIPGVTKEAKGADYYSRVFFLQREYARRNGYDLYTRTAKSPIPTQRHMAWMKLNSSIDLYDDGSLA
jgi:hypothetical protein